jgi:hypothetical protein
MSDKAVMVKDYALQQGFRVADGLSRGEYFAAVARQAGISERELTGVLWELYSPSSIWIIVLAIGLLSSALLFIYDRYKR